MYKINRRGEEAEGGGEHWTKIFRISFGYVGQFNKQWLQTHPKVSKHSQFFPKKLIVRDYYPENVPINWRKIVMDNIETVNILYNI